MVVIVVVAVLFLSFDIRAAGGGDAERGSGEGSEVGSVHGVTAVTWVFKSRGPPGLHVAAGLVGVEARSEP